MFSSHLQLSALRSYSGCSSSVATLMLVSLGSAARSRIAPMSRAAGHRVKVASWEKPVRAAKSAAEADPETGKMLVSRHSRDVSWVRWLRWRRAPKSPREHVALPRSSLRPLREESPVKWGRTSSMRNRPSPTWWSALWLSIDSCSTCERPANDWHMSALPCGVRTYESCSCWRLAQRRSGAKAGPDTAKLLRWRCLSRGHQSTSALRSP